MLVDSHCHLNYPGLVEDLPDVLERAEAAGIGHMLCICLLNYTKTARAVFLLRFCTIRLGSLNR